jgi:hypothetical protein
VQFSAPSQVSRMPIHSHVHGSRERLMNIVHHKGLYYLSEPGSFDNSEMSNEMLIDKKLWLIASQMPSQMCTVQVKDVVRFGRIPYLVSRLVLNRVSAGGMVNEPGLVQPAKRRKTGLTEHLAD